MLRHWTVYSAGILMEHFLGDIAPLINWYIYQDKNPLTEQFLQGNIPL